MIGETNKKKLSLFLSLDIILHWNLDVCIYTRVFNTRSILNITTKVYIQTTIRITYSLVDLVFHQYNQQEQGSTLFF